MNQIKYRADIDVLRAVAVLGVLLYHLDVDFLSGGYVGVDIFFVISGYLITKLIQNEIQHSGRLNFFNFYIRRARRLLPAFFFTLIVCFFVAYFLYPPPEMQQFGESLFYSLIGLANMHFWLQSGYFDAAAIYKPLLHIWSLSVEEQFYIVWPLMLAFLLTRVSKNHIVSVFILLFCLSFYLNFAFIDGEVFIANKLASSALEHFTNGASTVFFLMPFRVFEFLLGALINWIPKYKNKNNYFINLLVVIGFGVMLYPMFVFNESTLFPYYNALIPCVGASLLIYIGEKKHIGNLLCFPIMIYIGKISYSLYLFHWPLIVFYKYYVYDFNSFSALEQFGLGVVSFFAAALMHTYIEQPFRLSNDSEKIITNRSFALSAGLSLTLLVTLAIHVWNNNGWGWRMPHAVTQEVIDFEQSRRYSLTKSGCNILDLESDTCKQDAQLQILSVGDSHFYVGYNMLYMYAKERDNVNLISFGSLNNCDFALQDKKLVALGLGSTNDGSCQEKAGILSNLKDNQRFDILVISSLTVYRRGLDYPIVEYLYSQNKNIQVVIIEPYIDTTPYKCSDIINRFGDSTFCKNENFVRYFGVDFENDRFYDRYKQFSPVRVSLVELACKNGLLENCVTQTNGVPMFYDTSHFSLDFSLMLGERMFEVYSEQLAAIGIGQ